jgi:hypothetical protein
MMSGDRIRRTVNLALSASAVAVTLLAGCQELPMVQAVHQDCANAPDVKACEDADYARRYAEERVRNKNVNP